MSRRKKNQRTGPRVKRMKRPARLRSAVSWLKKYDGGNILRGYCKHYGVDWRCAALELKQLGVQIDADYLQRREHSERQLAYARKRRRQARVDVGSSRHSIANDSLFDTYLAEDYAALYAMQCERDGIDPLIQQPVE